MIDDPNFIDVMTQELKSQGLFDQFRKECLADVDTKPAYQNLRQRVEGTVSKFLAEQEWSDNIRYKNQLREQLRKNIIDSGYLDKGVERIVDQVVNPKISTVFQPKVEEIVYNYLGIEKPKSSVNGNEIKQELLLEDLEAVSPDSDKKSEGSASSPKPEPVVENTEEDMDIDDDLEESKEQEDFESPAFEPLEVRSPVKCKEESNDSNSSAISGLTSQESVESDGKAESSNVPPKDEEENPATKDSEFSQEIGPNNDSQLSQVSSNSQLLTTTAVSTEEEPQEPKENDRLDITEEAQMPTLFTSSADKQSESKEGEDGAKKMTFNFEKDEYDFVGTGRGVVRDDDNSSVNEMKPDKDEKEIVSETPMEPQTETPTETPTKETQVQSFTTQEDTTSQSEHSLKICEDTFSDEDTKEESRSADARQIASANSAKIKELSDASSCSSKSEQDTKTKPEEPKEPESNDEPSEQTDVKVEQPSEETSNPQQETEEANKTPKREEKDDHYEEHIKQVAKRRPSDRDSDDSNDKSQPSGPSAPPSDSKAVAEGNLPSSEKVSESSPGKETTNGTSATDATESSERRRARTHGSVTPSRVDSSSSGIQSGDDSEKSPDSIKTYAKSESIVLPVQPVVIDQMLTTIEDSQLERLLNGDMLTNDATLESLQRKWKSADSKLRKPKFASNFSEARRLMKVRKQMQREEQKCREQALAMAKKYLTENKSLGGQMAEDQGIELEFVCDGKRKSPGPMISSPVPKAEPPEELQPPEEPDLLYFPEEDEVYRINEKLLKSLETKTKGLKFDRNFQLDRYRTIVFPLSVTTVAKRAAKRPSNCAIDSPKIKRTDAAMNGLPKALELNGDSSSVSLALRRQRSIRANASRRLLEKNTPPSVGLDA